MGPDWANLEALALSLILDKLQERIDHVWFGVVCKSWLSIAKLNHQSHQFRTNVLPMLIIPEKKYFGNMERREIRRRLYGIPANKVYTSLLPSTVYSKLWCGCSHGWLAEADFITGIITLNNPFKDIAPISLPGLEDVQKVTLSADPIKSPNDYVVFATYGYKRHLAFIRGDQTFWTYVNRSYCEFNDVIFYKGLVYAVTHVGLQSFHLDYSNEFSYVDKITPKVLYVDHSEPHGEFFLVISLKGDLWMVKRIPGNRFNVYKVELDLEVPSATVSKLESLEDNVLFVGETADSISVSASYFHRCLLSDSIYFSSNAKIYNVKDGSIRQDCPYCPYSDRNARPLSWILPQFRWH